VSAAANVSRVLHCTSIRYTRILVGYLPNSNRYANAKNGVASTFYGCPAKTWCT
jgi:hypothetical protein